MKKIYMIGNTHFDPVWLWKWDEAMSSINYQDRVVFGNELKANYSYVNAEKEEGETVTQWLISSSKNGSYTPIEGAKGDTYTPQADVVGKYIKYRVIPKDILGNVGKTVDSSPVMVSLPSAQDSLSTKGIVFSQEGEATVASSTITNVLKDTDLKVSLIMAEYKVAQDGTKELLQKKKVNQTIKAGETITLSAKLTITDTTDKLVQAMVWTEPDMEPITKVAQLVGGKLDKVTYIDTEKDKEETSVFVYEINWMN
ncbi:MAG: hypothetical protein E7399_09205 [Ruminococcaceae bacterium]|nr:hypothetical protein [Oscillospiraceae bacterium]